VALLPASLFQVNLIVTQDGKMKIEALKKEYAGSIDAGSNKWVVITSVNPPTRQVQRICDIKGWNKVNDAQRGRGVSKAHALPNRHSRA